MMNVPSITLGRLLIILQYDECRHFFATLVDLWQQVDERYDLGEDKPRREAGKRKKKPDANKTTPMKIKVRPERRSGEEGREAMRIRPPPAPLRIKVGGERRRKKRRRSSSSREEEETHRVVLRITIYCVCLYCS